MARPQARGPGTHHRCPGRSPVRASLASPSLAGWGSTFCTGVAPRPQSSPQGPCSSRPTFWGSPHTLGGQVGWGLPQGPVHPWWAAVPPSTGRQALTRLPASRQSLGHPGPQVLEPLKEEHEQLV